MAYGAAGPRGNYHRRRGDRGPVGRHEGDRSGETGFLAEKKIPIPAGWIFVPVRVRTIPAYTMVTRDYLIESRQARGPCNRCRCKRSKGVITDLAKIRGRVMAREKPPTYAFTESDFLPAGTRPGVAGGTPQGKRAITLDAGKLKGVHELKDGDHVDLLASVAVDMPGVGHSGSGRSGTNFVASPDALLLPKRVSSGPWLRTEWWSFP